MMVIKTVTMTKIVMMRMINIMMMMDMTILRIDKAQIKSLDGGCMKDFVHRGPYVYTNTTEAAFCFCRKSCESNPSPYWVG